MSTPTAYDKAFYRGQGFDRLGGPEAGRVYEFETELARSREWLSLTGNLYEERIRADWPGTQCLLPVNWLALPERKFEYLVLRTEPGRSFPVHAHGYGDEVYVVLGGTGTVYVNGEAHEAGKHDVFHMPPGAPHGFSVPASSEETFDLFIVNAPGVARTLRSRYWAVEPQPPEP